jgi:hypothetical protein
MLTKHITIPKVEMDEYNAIIKGEGAIVGEHTIATFTAKFEHGIEADIKICGVKESADAEEDECTPYIDAVLFEDGNEVCVIEPCFDSLDGEYIFDYNNKQYRVTIH